MRPKVSGLDSQSSPMQRESSKHDRPKGLEFDNQLSLRLYGFEKYVKPITFELIITKFEVCMFDHRQSPEIKILYAR